MIYILLSVTILSSRFSTNFEASASEELENLKEMVPRHHIDCDIISSSKYRCVTRRERAEKKSYCSKISYNMEIGSTW